MSFDVLNQWNRLELDALTQNLTAEWNDSSTGKFLVMHWKFAFFAHSLFHNIKCITNLKALKR